MIVRTLFFAFAVTAFASIAGVRAAHATWTAEAEQCVAGGQNRNIIIDACNQALKSGSLENVEKARIYHGRGVLRALNGDPGNAVLDLTEAMKLDPNNPEHYFARGEVSMSRKQFPQAVADFGIALRLDGPSVRGYYSLGTAQLSNGDVDEAIADFSGALKLSPREVAILNDRAYAYFGKRDWDRALADYTAAITNDPKNSLLYFNRGEVWRLTNDLQRAGNDFDTAIRLKPDYGEAYIRRGFTRVAQHDFLKALADFDKAVQINPNSPVPLSQRGIARFYVGRYREAENDLVISLSAAPQNAYSVLWLYLARLHQGKDDITALRDQSRTFNPAVFPGPVIRFYLGEITVNDVMAAVQKGTPQQQREQLCEASFYLGEEALMRGNRDEAVRLFRQAMSTNLTYFYEYQGAAVEMQRLGL